MLVKLHHRWIPGLSRTLNFNFQDFAGPNSFHFPGSGNFREKNPGLTRTFQEAWEPCVYDAVNEWKKTRPDFDAGYRRIITVFDGNRPHWLRGDNLRPAGFRTNNTLVEIASVVSALWWHTVTISVYILHSRAVTETYTRSSSTDEIANVNFLACEGGYALERRFTKFSEITQCNIHYAVQGHSRSPILVPTESSYTTSY